MLFTFVDSDHPKANSGRQFVFAENLTEAWKKLAKANRVPVRTAMSCWLFKKRERRRVLTIPGFGTIIT
ncbi:MAG: hypothetical protein Q7S10_00440 [bacterium]|nr:hypothetical protein [bacterium]